MDEVHSRLLECYTTLTAVDPARVDRDVLIAIHHVASKVVERTLFLNNATRPCPGMYWRAGEEVKNAIRDFNNDKEKRKRKKVDTDVECQAERDKRVFGKYTGPDGARAICNVCGQALDRDVKRGFVSKTKGRK
jgi:hypothetical protein